MRTDAPSSPPILPRLLPEGLEVEGCQRCGARACWLRDELWPQEGSTRCPGWDAVPELESEAGRVGKAGLSAAAPGTPSRGRLCGEHQNRLQVSGSWTCKPHFPGTGACPEEQFLSGDGFTRHRALGELQPPTGRARVSCSSGEPALSVICSFSACFYLKSPVSLSGAE